MTHDCSETNQGEHVDHPKSWSACYHPSPVPSLHCWKQICQSKTPIKLTSCSLSDPLIKGKYPVYGLAFGSGVSSPQPCIILTLRGVLIWAWQDGKVVAFTALLRFLWRASALSVVCCLCRPHHPSQTPIPSHAVKPEDVIQASISPLLQDELLSECRRGFLSHREMTFQKLLCCGRLRLRARRFGLQRSNKLLLKTFPSTWLFSFSLAIVYFTLFSLYVRTTQATIYFIFIFLVQF